MMVLEKSFSNQKSPQDFDFWVKIMTKSVGLKFVTLINKRATKIRTFGTTHILLKMCSRIRPK